MNTLIIFVLLMALMLTGMPISISLGLTVLAKLAAVVLQAIVTDLAAVDTFESAYGA